MFRNHPVQRVEIGDLTLDKGSRRCSLRGQSIRLTDTEFLLLEVLGRSRGNVVTRKELMRSSGSRKAACKRSSTANSRRSTEASTYTSAISEENWDRTSTEPNAFAAFGMWATSTRCLRRRVPHRVRRLVSWLARLKAKNDTG